MKWFRNLSTGNKIGLYSLIATIIGLLTTFVTMHESENHSQPSILSPAESTVERLQDQISVLRGTFESIDDYGEQAARKITMQAPRLANQLLNLSDDNLKLGHQISKYEYSAYALTMAASSSSSRKIELSQQAIKAATQALLLIEQAKDLASTGQSYYQAVYTWLKEDYGEERTLYVLAIAQAINARNEGKISIESIYDSIERIKNISPSYLERYPLQTNDNLAWALAHSKEGM